MAILTNEDAQKMHEDEIFAALKQAFQITVYSEQGGVEGIEGNYDQRSEDRRMQENSKFRCKIDIRNGKTKNIEFEQNFKNNNVQYDTGVNWRPVDPAFFQETKRLSTQYAKGDQRLGDFLDNTQDAATAQTKQMFHDFKNKVEGLIKTYMHTFHDGALYEFDVEEVENYDSVEDKGYPEWAANLEPEGVLSKPSTGKGFVGNPEEFKGGKTLDPFWDEKLKTIKAGMQAAKPGDGKYDVSDIQTTPSDPRNVKQSNWFANLDMNDIEDDDEEIRPIRDNSPNKRYLEIESKLKNDNKIITERMMHILKNLLKE
jgi:hypothetical protein